MNFFKSIISDDQDQDQDQNHPSESDPDSPREDNTNPNGGDDNGDDWSFGGFIKSFATQSESVLETYRKDLQEFGSGLKKETEIFCETASQAVKELPASIDVVLKSTKSMITREPLGFSPDGEAEANRSLNSGRYSRFESQLNAIQSDLSTFREEPEDKDDYGKWKLGFELGDYRGEIDGLIGENGILEGVYRKAVPDDVDEKTFWSRYFYRVDKLKQQESLRANLVKRAIANDDEEDLSWDVDDDDEKEEEKTVGEVKRDEKVKCGESVKEGNDEKVVMEEKSDAPMVSNQEVEVEAEEDDIGWDEIGDVDGGDGEKTSGNGGGQSPKLRKRLSVVEDDDDEDLNWGIEDDDEPVKV